MDKTQDLESKYQKLAAEYSKIRSHATVLKKAVLEEQSKNLQLKDIVKECEQKIRKHDQEMESLTFRNDQLTKRISVLQQELLSNNHSKKTKGKLVETITHPNLSVLDEELHKKIIENAQLISLITDKDLELSNCKEKIEWLDNKLIELEKAITDMRVAHKEETQKLKQTYAIEQEGQILEYNDTVKYLNLAKSEEKSATESENGSGDCKDAFWKQEAERWKAEYEILLNKPENCDDMTQYYQKQIQYVLEAKKLAESEASILWAENSSLQMRLEHSILEKNALDTILEKSNEELHTTSENYKQQLDAMTEHIATQNERITKLSDEVEILKHKLHSNK